MDAVPSAARPRVVVMGPSGAGKSVVGAALAGRLGEQFAGLDFVDSDDLHPSSNVAKMRAGLALDDADRMPWLEAVGRALGAGTGGRVVACSALRRAYRDVIRAACSDAQFVELVVPPDELGARVGGRAGHFMPATLVAAQLDTLEGLGDDERGVRIENTGSVERVVERVIAALRDIR
ncbi:gluconokinase [Agromyces bauzanensis]|uniref:Gluconokinase n=1 Tax=Agromyces bauzanensis TaxID=1308924 RepID=A0A917P8F2_9MICO|nr:gluconokinase, GntK/IdnK-type [Agromyces bauzanensis]GGJ66665.1 gluconokinase [Agromyces bauzanensis]